jgi:ADP-heptose:LPS heptosyltransferase
MSPPAGPTRILVIKLGALGDIILSMEAFQSIREHHPDARITLLTRKPFEAITRTMPWFDEVLVDPSPKFHQLGKLLAFRSALRRGNFHRVYDLQTNDRTALYFHLLRPHPPEWCGIVKGCSHRRHDHRRDPVPATERLLRFLESVGVPRSGPPDLRWLDDPLDGFELPGRFALIIPGCAPQHPVKRWPARHFATLADGLQAKGLAVLAIGTKVDEAAIAEIQALAPHVISLAGKTTVPQIAALARRASTVVGNDTGPVHITAIAGAPTFVVMSRVTDPARMLPRGPVVGYLKTDDLADLAPADVLAALTFRDPQP